MNKDIFYLSEQLDKVVLSLSIVLLFCVVSSVAQPRKVGQNYYVSAAGDGSGDGSLADPWTGAEFQTIVDGGMSGLRPYSTIHFRAGDTFDYQYDLDNSTFRFDRYSTGANPIIRGSDDISGLTWTHDGSNVYYATMTTEPKGIVFNNEVAPMAEGAWILVTARPSTTKIQANTTTLNNANTAQAIVGSYILLKEWEFRPCRRVTATAYASGVIDVNTAPETDATGGDTGNPFKLLNRKVDIDLVGEWAWEDATDRIYIKTAGGAPSTIRVIARDYGIKLSTNVDNISIRNIHFKDHFLEGINGYNNHHVIISGCTFEDGNTNAVSFIGNSRDIAFTNNTVQNINNNGLHIGGVISYNVKKNIFSHIGDQVGVSIPYYEGVRSTIDYFKSVGTAVHTRWDLEATIRTSSLGTINDNYITDVGYAGVIAVGSSITAERNFVKRFMLKWSDGAGMYISGVYNEIYVGGSNTQYVVMNNNTVINGDNNTRSKEGYAASTTGRIMGMYMDNITHNCTISNNFIAKVNNFGVNNNWNTDKNVVTGNIVVNAGAGGYRFADGGTGGDTYPNSNGHTFTNNFAVQSGSGQYCLVVDGNGASYDPFASGGSCNNNRYVQPYNNKTVQNIFVATNTYDLAGWQAIFSHDGSSTEDLGPYLISSDSSKASLDMVIATNWGATSNSTLNTNSDNYYYDETGAHVTSATVVPYGGRVLVRRWPPAGSITNDDTYTGPAGNITGHTPDVGPAWTVDAGTISLNGSGEITASVNGFMIQDTGSSSVIMETTGKVASTAAVSCSFRQVNSTSKCDARLSINNTASSSTVKVFVDASEVESRANTMSTNTYYTIRVNAKGGTVGVFVDGVIKIDLVNNATIAAKNPSTTRHGLIIAVTGTPTHTRTTHYATSF